MQTTKCYKVCLQNNINAIPKTQREVRDALGRYLAELRKSHRVNLVWRLRLLAQFMRYPGNQWPRVIDRLFSSTRGAAEQEMRNFHGWVVSQHLSPRSKQSLLQFRLLSLSRMLKEKGVLSWEIRGSATQRFENKWSICDPNYRRFVEEWNRELKIHLELGTVRIYEYALLEYGLYLARNGISFLLASKEDALNWLEELKKQLITPTKYNLTVRRCQLLYDRLIQSKLSDTNPFSSFKMIRLRRRLPELLSEREMVQLIRAAKPGRDRAILEVLYATGCRLGELRRLDVDKVSFSERTARSVGKGGHDRILYLNASSLEAIRSYLPKRKEVLSHWGKGNEHALFISFRGNRLGQTFVKDLIDNARHKIGLNKRVTPHLFRHAFATHMLNRGADIYSLSQLLGHQSITSTLIYLQIATERLSAIHRKYHPRR